MQNEEKEFQDFMAKTLKAGNDFANDYNKLSVNNKLRFQQTLKMKLGIDIANNIITYLQQRF